MLFVFKDCNYTFGNLAPNTFRDTERIQCVIKRKIQRAHQAYNVFHRGLDSSLFDSLCFYKVTLLAHAINSLSNVIRNFNSAIADGFEFFCDRYV